MALLAGFLLLIRVPASLAAGESPVRAPSQTTALLHVGHLTLQQCESKAPWCGTLQRPLDPSGAVRGSLSIYFEYYPHTAAGKSAGTIVTTEGGPGFPATESRAEYLALTQPLRPTHDVLIMDNRGTGLSGAIDCKPLQDAPALTEANIGACGRELGAAAPLYSSTLAADDLDAVLDALSIRQIDLYGDSYGTYFAQVFALRHPTKLRSLVLDGAYPLNGPDYAWYLQYAPAMRAKFDLACERDAACKGLPGHSIERISATLSRVRAHPFQATAPATDGRPFRFRADASAFATVMFGSSPAYATVKELDAAARAFDSGDQLPLLRLMAETLTSVDSRDATHSPLKFSSGLAAAVSCQDPPQIVDMNLPATQRAHEWNLALQRRKVQAPDSYAPFTIDEYRRMPLDYAFIDQCASWPAPPAGTVRLPLVPGSGHYPDMPVLVISGELDNMTTVTEGAAATARFRNAHQVIIANSFHVNALPHARSACAAVLVRRFIQTLNVGDESCASAVAPVRLVPAFARHVSELAPARALTGNNSDDQGLRTVTAALLTAEDVIVRAEEIGTGSGVGLRGGSFTAQSVSSGYELRLREVRWTEDLSVSGIIHKPDHGGTINADLQVREPDGARGQLALQWSEEMASAPATAHGELRGKAIVAEAPAP
jgi:pimeloyl-ACP methyl ester carboxylesterase